VAGIKDTASAIQPIRQLRVTASAAMDGAAMDGAAQVGGAPAGVGEEEVWAGDVEAWVGEVAWAVWAGEVDIGAESLSKWRTEQILSAIFFQRPGRSRPLPADFCKLDF
jgi:hypothetical protein